MITVARPKLTAAQRRAIIQHILPKMEDLGKEMHRHLVMETPVESGDLRQDAYASVDDVTGNLEIGYDETGREKPHAVYVNFGTSTQDANPSLMRVVYFRRKPR